MPRDGRCGGGCRAHQMDHAALAHAAPEITIGGGGAHFAFGQNSVAHTQTRAAGRIGYTKTRIQKNPHDSFFERLLENHGCCRRYDGANAVIYLFPF